MCSWQQLAVKKTAPKQAAKQADAERTRHPIADTQRSDPMLKTFCSESKEYDQGYKNAQRHLFWFIVVMGVVCVGGGVFVGMCV